MSGGSPPRLPHPPLPYFPLRPQHSPTAVDSDSKSQNLCRCSCLRSCDRPLYRCFRHLPPVFPTTKNRLALASSRPRSPESARARLQPGQKACVARRFHSAEGGSGARSAERGNCSPSTANSPQPPIPEKLSSFFQWKTRQLPQNKGKIKAITTLANQRGSSGVKGTDSIQSNRRRRDSTLRLTTKTASGF